ncbi:hypothetical protein DESC_580074 [Desulfosarcina cetonica]|nr:hypothetical protein DESC_580074 [Desulfosarcina cetonica]
MKHKIVIHSIDKTCHPADRPIVGFHLLVYGPAHQLGIDFIGLALGVDVRETFWIEDFTHGIGVGQGRVDVGGVPVEGVQNKNPPLGEGRQRLVVFGLAGHIPGDQGKPAAIDKDGLRIELQQPLLGHHDMAARAGLDPASQVVAVNPFQRRVVVLGTFDALHFSCDREKHVFIGKVVVARQVKYFSYDPWHRLSTDNPLLLRKGEINARSSDRFLSGFVDGVAQWMDFPIGQCPG